MEKENMLLPLSILTDWLYTSLLHFEELMIPSYISKSQQRPSLTPTFDSRKTPSDFDEHLGNCESHRKLQKSRVPEMQIWCCSSSKVGWIKINDLNKKWIFFI